MLFGATNTKERCCCGTLCQHAEIMWNFITSWAKVKIWVNQKEIVEAPSHCTKMHSCDINFAFSISVPHFFKKRYKRALFAIFDISHQVYSSDSPGKLYSIHCNGRSHFVFLLFKVLEPFHCATIWLKQGTKSFILMKLPDSKRDE